ncbi:MAG TPA: ankyrin repeat domain-containing protein [Pyrinomonadaceae bacterium]
MSNTQLIDAVKTGQLAKVEEALNAGADIHQQDEQGWTPLNWAAGKGNVEIVSLLLNHGADVFQTGRDQRTPYKIALAAKHTDVARQLKKAESAANGASGDSTSRDYARAYLLGELRKFSGWREDLRELSDDDVVFLQQDFTVTELIWPGENVIFNRVTPEWIDFCTQELQFKVPDDFDLIASTTAAKSAEAF